MPIEWTGERLETFVYNSTTVEHLHRYALACTLCKNKDVLDIACGEGYGSALLAKTALSVTGVDINENVINNAKKKYTQKNILFKTGSTSKIPIADAAVDVVISFETIEHHDEHAQMLKEIKRVLRPGGFLLISSPDKKFYSDIPAYNNPFHIKELSLEDFKKLLKQYFTNLSFYFQKSATDSVILPEIQVDSFKIYAGSYNKVDSGNPFDGKFNICLASEGNLPVINASFFDGSLINNKRFDDFEKGLKNLWSYKIGHIIIFPLKMLRKIIYKKI